MPIMAAYEHSDARGSTRQLVGAVRSYVTGSYTRLDYQQVTLNNLFRLLEAYRSHGFQSYEYQSESERGPESLTLLPATDSNLAELRTAISEAISSAFRDASENDAVDRIENVLRAVAYPDEEQSDPEDRARATAFLDTLAGKLDAVT